MRIVESEHLNILLKLNYKFSQIGDESLTIKEMQKFLGYKDGYNYAYQIIKQLIKDGYMIKTKEIRENERGMYEATYILDRKRLFGLLSSGKTLKLSYLNIREEVRFLRPELFDYQELEKELNLNSS